MKKDIENARVGGGAKKYFILFAGLFALFAVLMAAYLLLPKATLTIKTKNQDKAISLDLTAAVQINAVNSQEKALPAKFEQISKDFSEDFDSTGSKEGGAKATGQAVIYNEFNPADQPLVATTRLETDDGKIFRITKNVVVPGVTSVGTETKPGATEVDIIADQPGESYNIGPANFKIPGFKDTPSKYEKFYAKSVKPTDGGSSGQTKVVTAQDISQAKAKIAIDGKKSAIEEMKSSLPPDRKILDDSVQIEVLSASFPDAAGAEKEKFSATAKIRASALSFQESEVKKIIEENLGLSEASAQEISFDQPINYMLTNFDMQQKTLKFQAKTDAKSAAGFDLENFKKGILGKKSDDAQVYAKNFPAIQKMDIFFWPFFVSRIPMSERRVDIRIN